MATRVFNKVSVNGSLIADEDFMRGTGVITLTGVDEQYVTDDHKIHNVRLNQKNKAEFVLFGDYSYLNTNPTVNNFGGTHIFYLDSDKIATFNGVVTAEWDEKERETRITIDGEVEDA